MALKDIKINVNADLLARACSCVSTKETRYYLNGVHIEPLDGDGVLMVATDGDTLIAIRDASGSIDGGTAIVSPNRSILAACQPRKTKTPSARRVMVADGRLSIVAEVIAKDVTPLGFEVCTDPTDDVIAFQWRDVLIDGTFPDWRKIVCRLPPRMGDPATGFNPALLGRLAIALSKDLRSCVVCSKTGGDGDPIWVSCPGGQIDGFGVIMPMRVETPKVPAWITFPVAATQQKAA